jgi:hypothetical protein
MDYAFFPKSVLLPLLPTFTEFQNLDWHLGFGHTLTSGFRGIHV